MHKKYQLQHRRQFIHKSLSGLAMLAITPNIYGLDSLQLDKKSISKPWIEISRAAYLQNVQLISKMAGGRPVVAVLKNNAYGLGDVAVARILDDSPEIFAIALVKDERALALRDAGVSKPILLMGDFDSDLGNSLVERQVTLSIYSKESLKKLQDLSQSQPESISTALYVDTGLGRMGIPYEEAFNIAKEVSTNDKIIIDHTFSTLTTPNGFAKEQIQRFDQLMEQLETEDISTGIRHLAPSYSLLDLPESHQQAVRPGILLHGSFPTAKMDVSQQFPLQVTYRLKAPVIRLEKLRKGDSIGFSRFYKIEKDEWIATLPIGWADGYDSGAENGAVVLLGNNLYPVVNVNASHANISLGENTNVKVGDIATLIGPDRPEITPSGFAERVNGHNYLQINYKESITKKVYETS